MVSTLLADREGRPGLRPLRGSEGYSWVAGWGPGIPAVTVVNNHWVSLFLWIPTPSTSLQTKVLGGDGGEELLPSANENKVRGWVEGQGMVLVQRGRCMSGEKGEFRAAVEVIE